MTWSFPIGRVLGSEVRIHGTFFFLLAWIAITAFNTGGLTGAVLNLVFILALFACVVAHEFGHALMAKRFGIRTPDITLLPIGGLARLERMPDRPGQEIAVALAGPLVNVVIAGLLFIAGVRPGFAVLGDASGAGAILGGLLSVNVLLVLFNMIPAFPMDGGRVLRGALSIFLPRLRATKVAVRVGQAFAVLFAAYGFWTGSFMLPLIAVFIFFAGNAELGEMSARAKVADLSVGDAMISDFTHLSPEAPLAAAAELSESGDQDIFPVIGSDGRLQGFVTRDALHEKRPQGEHPLRVRDLIETEPPSLPQSRGADALFDVLSEAPAIGVTGPSGRFVGYVTQAQAVALLRRRRGR
ncbi:Putative zinc metalloprotease Rip3 [Roseivivax sp. THAF40]|uniref:site-2 protease family protein n=1 Tax=unclassified Roseivivax TaxID=2639302 RepID=UPI00126811A2|nr:MULTISPECIES: site-2 protease family protein [unclassified Roseivivax]QFS83318.1 Putative zinc metalloprotease Rip3 [Roseivivax sp. THAF197b]QFT47062.1 Putative zinc metalloprotease Rip3 [Roseivivax sp. THAF40]